MSTNPKIIIKLDCHYQNQKSNIFRVMGNCLSTVIVTLYIFILVTGVYDTDFYRNYFTVIEYAEFFILSVLFLDIIFNYKKHSLISKRGVSTILALSILTKIATLITIKIYYTIYGLLILSWLISIIFAKWVKLKVL